MTGTLELGGLLLCPVLSLARPPCGLLRTGALRGFPRAGEERWTENDPPLRPLLRGMASGFTDFLARMKTAHKVKFKRDVNRRN